MNINQFKKTDAWELANWFMGMIAIFLMMLTGRFILLIMAIALLVFYCLHAWMGWQAMKLEHRFDSVKREIQYKKEELQDKKFMALLKEVQEIKKQLQKRKR